MAMMPSPDPSMMGAPGAMPPPVDPMMGGMGGMQPPGAMFPSLDPNMMGQAIGPALGMMQQDQQTLQSQQSQLLMTLLMAMLGNAPNPEAYAAQSQPSAPVASDLGGPMPPSDLGI
jgi:hypothetical protein